MAEEIKEEKKETKNKIDLKELFTKNKKLVIGILGAVVALIVIIILVVTLTGNDEDKKGNNNGNGNGENKTPEEEQYPDDAIFSDEETIKNEYGFSKEDAINVIKAFYHSDNYKFEAKARKDNMYEVTVTNTETNTADVYEVDPNDGSFVYLTNISEE